MILWNAETLIYHVEKVSAPSESKPMRSVTVGDCLVFSWRNYLTTFDKTYEIGQNANRIK